jgi:hypothetical protein
VELEVTERVRGGEVRGRGEEKTKRGRMYGHDGEGQGWERENHEISKKV